MAASGSINFNLTIAEVIPAGDGYGAGELIHAMSNFLTVSRQYGGTGSPTWELVWSDTVDLSGGAASVDLTALTRPDPLENVDMTGKKIVAYGLAGAAANTGLIKVEGGSSNPYELFGGDADVEIDVYPSQIILMASTAQADLAAVSSSVKTLDLSGTTTEQLHMLLIAGA